MERTYEIIVDQRTGRTGFIPWTPTTCTQGHPIARLGHAACPDCDLLRATWHCGDRAHIVWDPDHECDELPDGEQEVHYLDGRVEIVRVDRHRT